MAEPRKERVHGESSGKGLVGSVRQEDGGRPAREAGGDGPEEEAGGLALTSQEELKSRTRRKNREAASARCSGRFGEYKGTKHQHDKQKLLDKRQLYKNKQLNNSTSDDQIQALKDEAPWWFIAFKKVYKIIPELGQGHPCSWTCT